MAGVAFQIVGMIVLVVGIVVLWRAVHKRKSPAPAPGRSRVTFGVALIVVGLTSHATPRLLRDGPAGLIPATVLIVMVPWFDSDWIIEELHRPTHGVSQGKDWLWGWQTNLLGRRLRTAAGTGSDWPLERRKQAAILLNMHDRQDHAARLLYDWLDDPDPQLRAEGLQRFRSLPPGAAARVASPQTLLDSFIRLTVDPSPPVRGQAAMTLGAFDTAFDRIVPVLTTMLNDVDPTVRVVTCESLSRFGPDAVEAVAAMTALIERRDPVAFAAVETLIEIGPAAHLAIPVLVEAMTDPGVGYRGGCAVAVVALRLEPAEAILLIEPLLDEGSGGRVGAIVALCLIGEEARPWMPRIKALLNEAQVADGVAASLGGLRSLRPAPEVTVPVLMAIVAPRDDRPPDPFTRYHAAMTMRRYPEHAPTFVPALAEVLTTAEGWSIGEWAAIDTLAAFGPSAHAALPALRDAMTRADRGTRRMIDEAIAAIESR